MQGNSALFDLRESRGFPQERNTTKMTPLISNANNLKTIGQIIKI